MLTQTTRAYTQAEMDEYSDRMGSTATTIAMVLMVSVIVGGLTTLGAAGVHWLYAWLVGGVSSWMFPLVVGGAVTGLTTVGMWLTGRGDDWTDLPPEQATDVTATAYAAWRTEDDGLSAVYVFRVEEDRYVVISEHSLTPPVGEPDESGEIPATIPSEMRVVLLGEGAYRVALRVSLTGPEISLVQVEAMPEETDPDRDDESSLPDGLFMTGELPARIRRAIGVG